MKIIAVIPARYASTRLPGKPLADIAGKPMIQRVYERAAAAPDLSRVIVATDDERIEAAVKAFGGEAILTSPDLKSGTDRIAEVAKKVKGDVFVNVQGDEPLIAPAAIQAVAQIVSLGRATMGTLMTPLTSREELENPSVVKVLADRLGRAIYFSRFPIPYTRESIPANPDDFIPRKHLGLYSYTAETLARFSALSPSRIELAESLEQLRALENGIEIGIDEVKGEFIGVDTPEDLEKVRKILAKGTNS